ncbi:MAG: MarR family transcriptional regulator [Planctomycetia bacterium]|nr:MarR family transcriptional regulator [Planctomycetia bacterium]
MFSLEDEIVLTLRRVSQAVDTHSRYLWQEYGLTAPQLGTLRELDQTDKLTPTALSERIHVSAATLAGILKRLEARGLIRRKRDEADRRSHTLSLTEEGRRLSRQAPSLLRDQFRTKLAKMKPWERTHMLAILQRVAEMMDAPDDGEAPFLYHEPAPPSD